MWTLKQGYTFSIMGKKRRRSIESSHREGTVLVIYLLHHGQKKWPVDQPPNEMTRGALILCRIGKLAMVYKLRLRLSLCEEASGAGTGSVGSTMARQAIHTSCIPPTQEGVACQSTISSNNIQSQPEPNPSLTLCAGTHVCSSCAPCCEELDLEKKRNKDQVVSIQRKIVTSHDIGCHGYGKRF